MVSVQPRFSICEIIRTEKDKQIQVKNSEGKTTKVIPQESEGKIKLAIVKFKSEADSSEINSDELFDELYKEAKKTKGYDLLPKYKLKQVSPTKDAKSVGEQFGADMVLSGNIRKIGGVLIVSAKLIDCSSGMVLSKISIPVTDEYMESSE